MENENHHYITLFDDHLEGEGVPISPQSIMSVMVERGELLLEEDLFESKTQSYVDFDAW